MSDCKQARVRWAGERLDFDGELGSGYAFQFSGEPGPERGGSPMEFLLAGVAGCTAMDVVHMLRRMRQPFTGLDVEISGVRADEHPRVYTDVTLTYVIYGAGVEPEAVERAIALSQDSYCSASVMMARSGARLQTTYRLQSD